jgi:hypothetical protein
VLASDKVTFAKEIEIPQFTEELKQTLLQNASLDFDWSEISPTIFGAVFESTLNPETRRSGGMHYTSIENIHKVIDPLFLNDLRRELDEILEEKVEKQRIKKLDAYQDRLAIYYSRSISSAVKLVISTMSATGYPFVFIR